MSLNPFAASTLHAALFIDIYRTAAEVGQALGAV